MLYTRYNLRGQAGGWYVFPNQLQPTELLRRSVIEAGKWKRRRALCPRKSWCLTADNPEPGEWLCIVWTDKLEALLEEGLIGYEKGIRGKFSGVFLQGVWESRGYGREWWHR